MRYIEVREDGLAAAEAAVRRDTLHENPEAERVVREIIAGVRERRDAAVLELGRKFDSPALQSLEVDSQEWDGAESQVDSLLRAAIRRAASNIFSFHQVQLRRSWLNAEAGRITGQLIRPLNRVGIYVPGGTAVYPSSVLMCALPARAAGVNELIMCTPAGEDGRVNPLVLFAARMAGVSRVFKAGGAQAIAAMAFGTQSIPAVDKIVGPGNVYVNIAKRRLWGVVDIDMLAGPSEVCVLADESADPKLAAADILTQAEHDPHCAAYLITPSAELARKVLAEVETQLERQPRREILRQALDDNGAAIATDSMDQAIGLANACAPEHLALMVADPWAVLGRIQNAGAILMGSYSPQTLGDYLAGPSHTLPTSGTARFASPLNVDTFLKISSFIYYTREALEDVAPALHGLARAEGLEAHASAVTARFPGEEP